MHGRMNALDLAPVQKQRTLNGQDEIRQGRPDPNARLEAMGDQKEKGKNIAKFGRVDQEGLITASAGRAASQPEAPGDFQEWVHLRGRVISDGVLNRDETFAGPGGGARMPHPPLGQPLGKQVEEEAVWVLDQFLDFPHRSSRAVRQKAVTHWRGQPSCGPSQEVV